MYNKGGVQGTYQKLGYVNGRTSWNSSTGAAVWYFPDYEGWFFGPMAGVGGSSVYIIAIWMGNDSCFYDLSGDQWQYYDSGASAWLYVNVGDVSIQCLSGNFNKQFSHFPEIKSLSFCLSISPKLCPSFVQIWIF